MSHRLTVTLLAVAVLAACQSSPPAHPASDAEAAPSDAYAAAEAAADAASTEALRRERSTLDSIVVTGQRLEARQAKAAAPIHAHAPPPPPAPATVAYRSANLVGGMVPQPQAQPANT